MLLDVTRLIWRRWSGRLPTGIDRVCLAYVQRFGGRAQAVVQRGRWRTTLDRAGSDRIFALLKRGGPSFRRDLTATLTRSVASSLGKEVTPAGSLYLNIGHTGLDSPDLADWVKRTAVRPVYLIHDLIPITHPEYCRRGEAERHVERMRLVLDTAAGVIGNSQATIDSLAEFARRDGRAMPPSIRALLGVDLSLQSDASANPHQRPYFVMVGTIEGRKNHLLMLQLWSRMAEQLGERTPELVIVGQRGWESEQAVDLLERSQALRPHVRELGRCSDSELTALLSGARALLFPSMVEGYGLPLVEALAQGTPVLASNLPVFREIASDVPDYLDPLDGPAWLRAIAAFSEEPSGERAGQLARLRDYAAPTWDGHFTAVEDWLTRL